MATDWYLFGAEAAVAVATGAAAIAAATAAHAAGKSAASTADLVALERRNQQRMTTWELQRTRRDLLSALTRWCAGFDPWAPSPEKDRRAADDMSEQFSQLGALLVHEGLDADGCLEVADVIKIAPLDGFEQGDLDIAAPVSVEGFRHLTTALWAPFHRDAGYFERLFAAIGVPADAIELPAEPRGSTTEAWRIWARDLPEVAGTLLDNAIARRSTCDPA